jgi:hypothetical protein
MPVLARHSSAAGAQGGFCNRKPASFRIDFIKYAPYALASLIAFVLGPHIHLPFSNPWNITGILARAHINPADNIVRFLLFIAGPLLLLGAIWCVPGLRKRFPGDESSAAPGAFCPAPARQPRRLLFLLTLLFLVIAALNVSTYHSWDPLLDPFQEGESLGAGMTLLNGGAPYRDVVFVHGVFQDPLRSVVAFKLFGRSIGAVRTLESLMKLLCCFWLFAFLLVLYDGNYLYIYLTLSVLLIALFSDRLILAPRDGMTFLFLLAAAILFRALQEQTPRLSAARGAALVFFSFLPLASFMYSIDRGFYLLAAYIVLLPLVLFWFGRRLLPRTLAFSALGLGMGALFAGYLLQWQVGAFVDFTFRKIPRYKELMDGLLYPFHVPKFLLMVLILSWITYWIAIRFLAAVRASGLRQSGAFLRRHLLELGLLLLSLCFFRSALGRSDWEHVRYSCVILYLLCCYLLIRYRLHPALQSRPRAARILARSVGVVMVAAALVGIFRIGHAHLLARNFPFKVPDVRFVPLDFQQGSAFLRANLSPQETFFTLTSEGAWYYLADRPCPARFPVVWFAMPPFYQQEIVRDLAARNVKLILYRNQHWFNAIDGFPATERLPILDAYIRRHYRPYTTIAGNEFWIRQM